MKPIRATSTTPPADPGKERIRLSLDVSPETYRLLEELAAATDGTKSDVLRKGIALMDLAVRSKREGRKLGIIEQDQPLVTEIVVL